MDLCKVNGQCLPQDRISNLPLSIIHTILTLMPIREAFRTSILSRKWRYHCINIPKLEFDEKLVEGSTDSESYNKCKIFNVVYSILLLHNDPVLEFSLSFSRLDSSHDIDRIILYLSRNATLEKFTLSLCMGRGNEYKLPSSFFSLQKLTHLKLKNCEIQPLSTIAVLSTLTSLWFDEVRVPMSMLLKYLRCFPLLRSFTLIKPSESWYSKFFELLRCLPLIENLHMDYCFEQSSDEPFPFGVSLERGLPNMLVHLRALQLDQLSLSIEDEIRSVLVLLTSSPNIEKINLEMHFTAPGAISQTSMNFFDLHDYSYVILDNLRELEITNFSNKKPEMDFVKFILSKSPMLKRIRIVINDQISVSDEVKILKNLLWIPSSSIGAQIKFERP